MLNYRKMGFESFSYVLHTRINSPNVHTNRYTIVGLLQTKEKLLCLVLVIKTILELHT